MHEWNEHYRDITMNDWLEQYLWYKEDKTVIDTFKPSFCYRLDRDTSWILVSAKNYEALKYLNKLIQDRGGITKRYHAICIWKPVAQKIDKPLFKWFNAKFERAQTFVNHEKWLEAISFIKPLKTITHDKLWVISLVEVEIKTGRMHQIRVHLASIWYPIIWDIMYWDEKTNWVAWNIWITRQLLHASHYRFLDHRSKEIVGDSALPEEMVSVMKG
jgi:23S rRNA-/tRNA-specific pseudouridylate synthase